MVIMMAPPTKVYRIAPNARSGNWNEFDRKPPWRRVLQHSALTR
jgi:hypothetical protein